MTVIAAWMREVARSGSWRRHDDLHLDAVVGERERSEWLWEAVKLAPAISAARDEAAPAFAVILAFGLRSSTSPVQATWSSEAGFATDLNESPPSLYMYERGTGEWADVLSDNVHVKVPPFLATLGDARYRQVWEDLDREYRRSLLFVL